MEGVRNQEDGCEHMQHWVELRTLTLPRNTAITMREAEDRLAASNILPATELCVNSLC